MSNNQFLSLLKKNKKFNNQRLRKENKEKKEKKEKKNIIIIMATIKVTTIKQDIKVNLKIQLKRLMSITWMI